MTAALALLSFLINVWGVDRYASATFYSPASRSWELLLGAILAMLHTRPGGRAGSLLATRPQLAGWGGAALLVLGLVFIDRTQPFPGWAALLPVGAALLLIAAGPNAWFNRVVLSNRLMVWIGLISYPLYLWHWPLLSFAQIVESQTPAPAIRAGALALSVVLAWLTWRLVERPLRHGGGRGRVALLSTLLLAVAGAGGAIYLKDGVPSRATVQESLANQKALVVVEDKANAAACKARYGFDTMYEYCLLAQVDKDPTVALIGDSHGYHVVAGLTRYYSGRGDNLIYLGTRVPWWGLDPGEDPYQKATQPMLDLALATPSIHTVLFSTHRQMDALMIGPTRETLRRFLAAGKHVIFMNDVPTLDFDPRSCIKRPGIASSATRSSCWMQRSDFERARADHDAALRQLAREFPQVEWFNPVEALCDATRCHAMIGGRLMYRDRDHLSYDGDLLVGELFARRPAFEKPQAQ